MFKKLKKRKGFLGANISPVGVMIGMAISTVVVIAAVASMNSSGTDAKLSALEDEIVEVYNSAKKYSQKATVYGYGFDGINAESMEPYRTNDSMALVGTGASSYLCSASSFGCQVRYYLAEDSGDGTFHVYVDAQNAFDSTSDADKISRYELSIERVMTRMVKRAIYKRDATAVTAADTTPAASTTSTGDGSFEIALLM